MSAAEAVCRHHRSAPAGWACDRCGKKLCEECVYEEPVQHTSFIGCVHCGAPVGPLRIHRDHLPFGTRVLKAWSYPLRLGGLASMVAMALIVGPMRWGFGVAPLFLKPFMFGMWLGSFWGYVMHLVRRNAVGDHGFSGPEFRDFWGSLLNPAIKGTIATAFVWVPTLVYVMFLRKAGFTGLHRDPLLWLIGIAGVVYGPMALLMASAESSVFTILNPVFVFGYISKIGRDYWVAVGWLAALALVGVLTYVLSAVISTTLIPYPVIGPFFGEVLTSYPPLVMAYILGALLYVRGDRVEYGLASDYYVDARPDLKPKGRNPGAPEKVAVGDGAPAELPTDVAADGLGHAFTKGRAVSLEPEGADAVTAAIAESRLDDALTHYRTLNADDLKRVAAEHHVAVGQKAASSGDFTLAVNALKAAATNAEDPSAPKAFVILARIYGERLNDAATAKKLFHHVATRYPATQAGAFAKQQLSKS